jgi:uncharacterized protein YbjT (DUF2867 family)
MSQTVLVVGATGNHGQPVARQLHQDGFDVRVFTRKREKAEKIFGDKIPIYEGKINDDDSLRAALAGCHGVHINLRVLLKQDQSDEEVVHQGTVNILRLAREAGVQRVTFLSFLFATPETSFLPPFKAKLDAEAAVRASGIPYAIFAPTFFMENARHLTKQKRLFLAASSRAFHYVSNVDYAAMVSRVYQLPAAPNKRFEVYGPELIQSNEATRIYCAAVRPGTRVYFVPHWLLALYWRVAGSPMLRQGAKMAKLHQSTGEPGDPLQADTSLGRATTTLREWCEAERRRAG